jgi:hypothetical protein
MRIDIEVSQHDNPNPALRGWYWRCACEKCEADDEWNFFGPFKTERQAERDAKRSESKRTATYCVTAAVMGEDEQRVDLEIMSITARTAEAAAVAASFEQTRH